MKKKLAAVIFCVLSAFGFSQNSRERLAIEEYINSMDPLDRISQLFLVNVEGSEKFLPVEYYGNKPVVPGGILLFSYNIASTPEKIMGFTDSISSFCEENSIPGAYVAVDQEGGLVNRLRGITGSLPSNMTVASDMDHERASRLYSCQARQMKLLGITMNLGPVVECAVPSNAEFLGKRTFGTFPLTAAYSVLCIRAYETQGIGCTVKHFPGNTNTDPHTGLPEISLSEYEVGRDMLIPFAFALAAEPSCVLMSHARVRGFDETTPACLSSFWVKDMLREKLGFEGLVISDDIFMDALNANGFPPETAAVRALEAGVQVIMLSEKRFLDYALVLMKRGQENPDFAATLLDAQVAVIWFKIKKGILALGKLSDGTLSVTGGESACKIPLERRLEEFNESRFGGSD